MTPQEVYRCIEAVLGLPLSKQAVCVRFAAEVSAPVWREWCKRRGVEDHSGELLDTFARLGVPLAMVYAGGYGPDVWEVHYFATRRLVELAL